MSNDDEHNGWTNRETWAFMLYLDNDEDTQNMTHEFVRDNLVGIYQQDNRRGATADALRRWASIMFTRSGWEDAWGCEWPEHLEVCAEDIGSTWRIDFYECAVHMLEAIDEDSN